jgi:hypothetical protein
MLTVRYQCPIVNECTRISPVLIKYGSPENGRNQIAVIFLSYVVLIGNKLSCLKIEKRTFVLPLGAFSLRIRSSFSGQVM